MERKDSFALPGSVLATDQDAHIATSNAAASVTSELAKNPPNITSANTYQAMSTVFTAVASTSVTSYPIYVTPAGLISSTNPDVMNQSTLFTIYVENPPATITATTTAPSTFTTWTIIQINLNYLLILNTFSTY